MMRKLAPYLLSVSLIVLLPLGCLGATVIYWGWYGAPAGDNPVYRVLVGIGLFELRPSADRTAERGRPDFAPGDPDAPTPEPLSEEASRLETGAPAVPIAELPQFSEASPLGLVLADRDDVVIDYVSVPAGPTRLVWPEVPITVSLRPLEGARLLVLVGQPGQSWRIEDRLPEGVLGILVLPPSTASEGLGEPQISGQPADLPVERLAIDLGPFRERALPFLAVVVPSCRDLHRVVQKVECDYFVRRDERPVRSQFLLAEERLIALTGAKIGSLSMAYADDRDRRILIPEQVVDEVLRRRIEEELARINAAIELADKRRSVLRDYARKWVFDRREAAFAEMSARPLPDPSAIVARKPRVLVVSAYGSVDHVQREDPPPVANYPDYLRLQEAHEVGKIGVTVTRPGPVVLIATAYRPIRWRLELGAETELLAVHVEGIGVPSIEGVPDDVPLVIKSNAFGDREAAGYIDLPKEMPPKGTHRATISRQLERFMNLYPGSTIMLYGEYTLDEVVIGPDSDMGGELESDGG